MRQTMQIAALYKKRGKHKNHNTQQWQNGPKNAKMYRETCRKRTHVVEMN